MGIMPFPTPTDSDTDLSSNRLFLSECLLHPSVCVLRTAESSAFLSLALGGIRGHGFRRVCARLADGASVPSHSTSGKQEWPGSSWSFLEAASHSYP